MELATKDIQLFHELAYFGLFKGHEYAAKDIFTFLQHIRPEADEPLLGQALNLVNNGNADHAIEFLDAHILDKNPAHIQARLYKIMAYKKLDQIALAEILLQELQAGKNLDEQTTLMLDLFKMNELTT